MLRRLPRRGRPRRCAPPLTAPGVSCPARCSLPRLAVRGAGHPDWHHTAGGGAPTHHQSCLARHQEAQAQGGAAAGGPRPGKQVSGRASTCRASRSASEPGCPASISA
jgi:hypothetical protein